MLEDDLMQEIRAAREAYCQQFGYDLAAIMRHLREREQAGNRPVVRLAPRRPVVIDGEQSEPANAPDQTATPPHHSEHSVGGLVR
jgi:hypothetical protein